VAKVDVARRERHAKALQLRKAGMEYGQIAEQLGYANRSGAWKAVMGLLRRAEAPAVEMRQLLLARLDELLLSVWPRAIGGDMKAVDRAMNIVTRQAFISGAIKAEIHVPKPPDQAHQQFVEFLRSVVADPQAFAAARRLQAITDGAIEVEAEVVPMPTNGDEPSAHANGGGA